MTKQTEALVEEVYDMTTTSNWDGVIEMLKPYVASEPENHWFQSMTGIAYYHKSDVDNAYHYIEAGLRQKSDCPMGLWLMANMLNDRGETQRAAGLWEMIAAMDPNDKEVEVSCLCCNWETMGRTLVADSKLMLAVAYDKMGYKELAKQYRNGYLKAMSTGVRSMVDQEKVRAWLLKGQA